jgi:hypothetical protein
MLLSGLAWREPGATSLAKPFAGENYTSHAFMLGMRYTP